MQAKTKTKKKTKKDNRKYTHTSNGQCRMVTLYLPGDSREDFDDSLELVKRHMTEGLTPEMAKALRLYGLSVKSNPSAADAVLYALRCVTGEVNSD